MKDDWIVLIIILLFLFFMMNKPRTVIVEKTEKGYIIVEK